MRPPAQSEGWTPERVATLERMWGAGASASEIQRELGGVTRNGVIGKIHRMKLHRTARKPKGRPAPKGRAVNHSKIAALLRGPQIKPEPAPIAAPVETPCADGVDFYSLTNTTCRWPKGGFADPAVMFCGTVGADLNDGKPYCSHHMRVSRL